MVNYLSSGQDPSQWNDDTLIQGGLSYLKESLQYNLEMPLELFPVICFHGDSKCQQVENQDSSSK